jgi:hypothetical protein
MDGVGFVAVAAEILGKNAEKKGLVVEMTRILQNDCHIVSAEA